PTHPSSLLRLRSYRLTFAKLLDALAYRRWNDPSASMDERDSSCCLPHWIAFHRLGLVGLAHR
ncbi:MAG: hypothetical protein OER90_20260, partial [Gemmatimonadota bacterium]|nr:hypothetical protein [Gemmatimonadota bacterium]